MGLIVIAFELLLTRPPGALEVEDIELGAAQEALGADIDEGYASDAEALDTQSEAEDETLQDLPTEDIEG